VKKKRDRKDAGKRTSREKKPSGPPYPKKDKELSSRERGLLEELEGTYFSSSIRPRKRGNLLCVSSLESGGRREFLSKERRLREKEARMTRAGPLSENEQVERTHTLCAKGASPKTKKKDGKSVTRKESLVTLAASHRLAP